MASKDINKDIIKRDGAERRREDIAAHGKPTAFRQTMTKNKKAYSRKEKHKVQFAESDLREMVERCVNEIIKGTI
jgi:stalled ribosome alternative rescue factor ArfA